jgi:hypothetical protein
MPRLTKADVARHLQISRQTLYEWISKGRISVGHDGLIDSAEVARVSGSVTKADVNSERHHGQGMTSPMGDTTRELIEVLKAQLEEARARERFLQEQVDRLTSIIDRRLLEAPRVTPPAQASSPSPRTIAPVGLPATWQRILSYLHEHPGPQRAQDIEQALGLTTPARFVLKRMTDAGLLRRVTPGVYGLAG